MPVGDKLCLLVVIGALGFWNALTRHWPTVVQQRCWAHKTANVLNKLPKAVQPKVKERLLDVRLAEAREAAHQSLDHCVKQFYTEVSECNGLFNKDRKSMLAFYDLPA